MPTGFEPKSLSDGGRLSVLKFCALLRRALLALDDRRLADHYTLAPEAVEAVCHIFRGEEKLPSARHLDACERDLLAAQSHSQCRHGRVSKHASNLLRCHERAVLGCEELKRVVHRYAR